MNDLKNVVTKWVYMIGMTGKVSDKDIIAVTTIIVDLFPNITIKQIEMAIKLSLQGALEVDTDTYGTFSPLYVSKILNAYLTYSKGIIKEVNWRKMSVDQMNQKQLEIPYEQRLNSTKDTIAFYIEKVTTTNDYIGDFNNIIWELLKRMNMLNPRVLPLDEADKWAENKAILMSQTTDAKRFSKMSNEQRKNEINALKKMYGRYYVLRKFFRDMDNPTEWLNKIEDKILLPK